MIGFEDELEIDYKYTNNRDIRSVGNHFGCDERSNREYIEHHEGSGVEKMVFQSKLQRNSNGSTYVDSHNIEIPNLQKNHKNNGLKNFRANGSNKSSAKQIGNDIEMQKSKVVHNEVFHYHNPYFEIENIKASKSNSLKAFMTADIDKMDLKKFSKLQSDSMGELRRFWILLADKLENELKNLADLNQRPKRPFFYAIIKKCCENKKALSPVSEMMDSVYRYGFITNDSSVLSVSESLFEASEKVIHSFIKQPNMTCKLFQAVRTVAYLICTPSEYDTRADIFLSEADPSIFNNSQGTPKFKPMYLATKGSGWIDGDKYLSEHGMVPRELGCVRLSKSSISNQGNLNPYENITLCKTKGQAEMLTFRTNSYTIDIICKGSINLNLRMTKLKLTFPLLDVCLGNNPFLFRIRSNSDIENLQRSQRIFAKSSKIFECYGYLFDYLSKQNQDWEIQRNKVNPQVIKYVEDISNYTLGMKLICGMQSGSLDVKKFYKDVRIYIQHWYDWTAQCLSGLRSLILVAKKTCNLDSSAGEIFRDFRNFFDDFPWFKDLALLIFLYKVLMMVEKVSNVETCEWDREFDVFGEFKEYFPEKIWKGKAYPSSRFNCLSLYQNEMFQRVVLLEYVLSIQCNENITAGKYLKFVESVTQTHDFASILSELSRKNIIQSHQGIILLQSLNRNDFHSS